MTFFQPNILQWMGKLYAVTIHQPEAQEKDLEKSATVFSFPSKCSSPRQQVVCELSLPSPVHNKLAEHQNCWENSSLLSQILLLFAHHTPYRID